MSRIPILHCGLLAGVFLYTASPGLARGDQDNDDVLARQMLTAAGRYTELQEVTASYGRRAEIALTILQDEQTRADLVAAIREMDTVIANFPQNRRWWLADQQAFFDEKLARDRQLNQLDRELSELRLEEKRMYKAELEKARASGKPVRLFHREALLNELQRLDRESRQSVAELKEGIEVAARKDRTTPRQVLLGAVGRLASLRTSSSPDVEREFLPRFIKSAGGDSWLDGKKAAPGKAKKGPSRARKNRARSDDAPF